MVFVGRNGKKAGDTVREILPLKFPVSLLNKEVGTAVIKQ